MGDVAGVEGANAGACHLIVIMIETILLGTAQDGGDANGDGNLDIYVQHVDGSEAVARVEEPGDQTNPRWSPDGRYLQWCEDAEFNLPGAKKIPETADLVAAD